MPGTTQPSAETRDRLTDYEQMQDAQKQCVPCALCGGKAVISDAGTGMGYYINCSNYSSFQSSRGCMIDQQRLGGWAYNVMDWWNRLHIAALTRRAGGDAIPAGWQLVPPLPTAAMLDAAEASMANSAGIVRAYKAMLAAVPASATPKPPAGGDVGAVATIADLQRRRASDLDAVINLSLCLKEARDALEWYRDTVGRCRMMHAEGDEARNALHKDCGERAEKALAFRVPAREPKHDQ